MQELLTNAWIGWQQFVDSGKYVALLLLVLLFLWFRGEEEKQKHLLIYTTVATVLCIFPVSAAFLMMYQTRFYDYQWIWNYVPITIMIAYGGTVFLAGYWQNHKKSVGKCVGVMAAVLVLVFLSGSLRGEQDAEAERQQCKETQAVLEVLLEQAGEETICLWAPKDIMDMARSFDGRLQLLYGRNMWDAALGAYSYEIYGELEETLYRLMCHLEETGEAELTEELVLPEDVNRILLPGNIQEADLQQLSDMLGVQPEKLGNYYLLMVV